MSSKLAPHPRLPTTRIARLELGLLLMFRHSHAQESAAHSFSRVEEELVVSSPPAPGVARQLLPDTVDIERRMYETMPKSDLTAGMVKGEDGRTRFKIIEFWRAMEPRYPLHAAIAFRVYSVLPTEANCERVFSRAGSNMAHMRRNTKPKTLSALVMVGCYLQNHGDIEEEDEESK